MSYWAVQTLRRISRDLRSFEDGRIPNNAVDGFVLNLEIAYRELLVQEQRRPDTITCACYNWKFLTHCRTYSTGGTG